MSPSRRPSLPSGSAAGDFDNPTAFAGDVEKPAGSLPEAISFGSDLIAQTLRELGIEYIALTPGASFRGLHDSLVNFLGNRDPQMLVCLHEEHAVALAHGYAKVTGKAMAAAVHSNVGLLHASMAIFNAWCDRMPALVIGATGPVDAARRRPWIDWIHTARDQGALVRGFTKWDDQPESAAAGREAVIRAGWIANTAPAGPTYVNLPAEVQETAIPADVPKPNARRYAPEVRNEPGAGEVDALVRRLEAARAPLFLIGRVSRSEDDWNTRIAVAEHFGARVLTDLRVGAAFPTDHALHAAPPAIFPSAEAKAQLRDSDLIVSFDWVDLGGAIEDSGSSASITQVSLDYQIHRGWSMDYCSLPPVAHHIDAHPDRVFDAIAKSAGVDCRPHKYAAVEAKPLAFGPQQPENRLFVGDIATALMQSANRHPVSLLHLPISWEGRWWHFRHPLDYLGSDGGGGIGGGPGIAVGAALALRGTGRLPVAICGDGDFVMGATAIWTAVRYRIPLLVVVANNTSFFNDEVHQERMARARARPVENKWIGQRMADPEIDIAGLARAQGARAFGEVHDAQALVEALRDGIDIVNRGGVAVVDVRVSSGYPTGLETSLNKGKS